MKELLGDREIEYTLIRKSVKNINLRIRSDGSVTVSANRRVPQREISAFLIRNADFILRGLERVNKRISRSNENKEFLDGEEVYFLGKTLLIKLVPSKKGGIYSDGEFIYIFVKENSLKERTKLFKKFVKEECKEVFSDLLQKYFPLFKRYIKDIPSLKIRNYKSKWGSCTPSQNLISLNEKLIEKPIEAIEYVVMHEYCHFLVQDHSKKFYEALSTYMPDYKERKDLLKI